ncbi:MAG: hypothetical protein K8F90_05060 [Hyphomicrobiales bacterium]|nr:hypothetical protein [Hyphomicrobiales bacterium]
MRFAFIICCCLGLVLTACKEEAPTPFLKIVGGSFIFNYRYSKMSYGFVARQLRPLPDGSILEASFELPGTDRKYVITKPARSGQLQYSFETEALHGVKKDTPYKVQLKLLEAKTGKELARIETTFKSEVDQDSLPSKAPVVGPGYQANPDY